MNFFDYSFVHKHRHIHLDHIVSDTTKARRARELFVLPNVMPLRPKCVRYTPTRDEMVVRNNSRQMTQFTAVQAPEQEQLFIEQGGNITSLAMLRSIDNSCLLASVFPLRVSLTTCVCLAVCWAHEGFP